MLLKEWDMNVALEVAQEEAAEDRSIEIARTLLADGMDVERVARVTKLAVDDVLKLKQL